MGMGAAVSEYKGNERRKFAGLSDEEIEHIADKAAERAIEKVYTEVGRGVLKKLAWIVGVVIISALVWLSHLDKLKV